MIVVGEDRVQVQHRRSLRYSLRGQINGGCRYITGIGIDDPTDSYTAIFPNLLDDEMIGVLTARDYGKRLYAAPILLTKEDFEPSKALSKLSQSGVQFYTGKRREDG